MLRRKLVAFHVQAQGLRAGCLITGEFTRNESSHAEGIQVRVESSHLVHFTAAVIGRVLPDIMPSSFSG